MINSLNFFNKKTKFLPLSKNLTSQRQKIFLIKNSAFFIYCNFFSFFTLEVLKILYFQYFPLFCTQKRFEVGYKEIKYIWKK